MMKTVTSKMLWKPNEEMQVVAVVVGIERQLESVSGLGSKERGCSF
jgi:uncharacterized protein (UPF0248 family)